MSKYRYEIICLTCNERCLNSRRNGKFCSPKCKGEYMMKNDINQRKYSYNRQYFSTIDTPAKAYWVGFILGDGHLRKNGKSITFTLASKDAQQLYNFIDEIGGDREQVKYRYYNNKSCLSIDSKQMVQDLILIDVPSKNKSYTAKPLSLPYQSAFWLGLFDADGSVGIYDGNIYIKLCGTKSICTGFSKFLGYGGRYIYKIRNCWEFKKSCNKDYKKICRKIYKFNIQSLERKKQIFERYKNGNKMC